MQEDFYEHLKKGEFRASICDACGRATFPVSIFCRHCGSRARLGELGTATGTLLEYTRSHIDGTDSQLGYVEMAGIRVIGTFGSGAKLREGMKVKMDGCGLALDGKPFYLFSPVSKKTGPKSDRS